MNRFFVVLFLFLSFPANFALAESPFGQPVLASGTDPVYTPKAVPSAAPDMTTQKLQALGILPKLPPPPDLPPGFIPWSRFMKLDPTLKDLSGTKVKVAGFMFPLDEAEQQKHFLLSVYPPSCPFCMPAGPEGLIEVLADKGITFDYNLIKIEGTIEFPDKDPMGLKYRVTGGAQIQ